MVIPSDALKAFESPYKLGLVITKDDEGDPHITLMSTIMGWENGDMTIGEIIKGISTDNFEKNKANDVGFLIMSLDLKYWTGLMNWKYKKTEGEEYTVYNNQPIYRYNAYFGVHTVHYFDLKELSDKKPIPLVKIVGNALKASIVKGKFNEPETNRVLRPWAEGLMKRIDSLKFLGYFDNNGEPRILPVVQAQGVNSSVIVIPASPYNQELKAIPAGTRVALFCADLKMETVLVNGVYSGVEGSIATIKIDRVYNSMPPKQGPIYPEVKNEAVTDF